MPDDDPHERREIQRIRREAEGVTSSAADAAAEYEGRETRNAQDRERYQNKKKQ